MHLNLRYMQLQNCCRQILLQKFQRWKHPPYGPRLLSCDLRVYVGRKKNVWLGSFQYGYRGKEASAALRQCREIGWKILWGHAWRKTKMTVTYWLICEYPYVHFMQLSGDGNKEKKERERESGAKKRRTDPRAVNFGSIRSRFVNVLKNFSILPVDNCFVASCRFAFSHKLRQWGGRSWLRLIRIYEYVYDRLLDNEEEREKGRRDPHRWFRERINTVVQDLTAVLVGRGKICSVVRENSPIFFFFFFFF